MRRAKTSRKALFRAALAIAGMTASEWAAREGVTAPHLSMVLSEKRESLTLIEKIDAFTREYLPKHRAASAA